MKVSMLKDLIKESVREVFKEELKDIILESIKKNPSPLTEGNIQTPQKSIASPNVDIHTLYKRNMDSSYDTQFNMTSNDVNTYRPLNSDPVNGSLPSGEVDLSQIASLLNG